MRLKQVSVKPNGGFMEYKTIICPLDGTDLMEIAEESAVYISKISGAKLILLHVVEKWYKAANVETDSKEWEEIHEKWLNEGKVLLEKEATRLIENGLKNIDVVLRDGDAAYEIIAEARERNADLLVMATHHYSTMGKLFWGSVADRVTKKSPCPILWVFK